MEKTNIKRIALYIFLVALLWCITTLVFTFLEAGTAAYNITGILFTTPAPFISVLIISTVFEKRSIGNLFKDIFYVERPKLTWLITALFCGLALILAVVNGTPNGSRWYMMPLGFVVMIPFVGIAEETGWRGFLQPEFEKKLGFIPSTLIVGSIWCIWHIDQWFDPASNHFGDSFVGFAVNILVWAFALGAIYKISHSILACALYHAFVNSIGAVYDWNLIFDVFPGNIVVNIYRIAVLSLSLIIVWTHDETVQRY